MLLMKSMLFSLLLLLALGASAQTTVTLDEVKSHVGDSVTVTGKVFGVKYFPNGRSAPTLVNLGAAFPNQLLTVVIYEEQRKAMAAEPEKALADAEITVTGKVELYRDKPQIVIRTLEQLKMGNGKKAAGN